MTEIPATYGQPYRVGYTRTGLVRLSRVSGNYEHYVLFTADDVFRVCNALIDAAETPPDGPQTRSEAR